MFLLVISSALAQDPRGRITGQVVDTSSSMIPGVEVRAVNSATQVAAVAKTNAAGSFTIPFLLPGTYTVTAEMTGFKRFSRDGIQVRVSEATELLIRMEIGALSETVEVNAESPLIDTASASLGQVIDERRISELPLLAGNAFELALLTPGVVNGTNLRDRKPAFNNGNSQVSADGNGTYNNEFQIDGVSNTFADGSERARVAFSPPSAAIQEFKMQTSSYDASIGHTVGALVNVSTTAGTNDFHGEAHWFVRNRAFDAPNFFNNKAGTKPAVYQDNRYGASAGGPVLIPKIYNGKNRTFWFHAWEANKWKVPTNFLGTVPTPAERRGDFSALLPLTTGDYRIYDPATTAPAPGGRFSRLPFPNNVIPASRLDPVGLNLIKLYPEPTQPGTPDGRNNFFNGTLNALEDYYTHISRVDHAFSENHRAFLRLHYDWWEEDKNDHFSNRVNGIILNRINRGLALDDVLVLNPTLILNLRYGLTQQEFPEQRVSRGFNLASLGFSPALVGLVEKDAATIPRVSIPGYSTISPWESGDGTNSGLTHSFAGNFTKLAGSHNLRFGADVRIYRSFGNRIPRMVSPDLSYSTTYTRGPLDNSPSAPIGQDLAAMLLGVPGGSMERTASYALQDKFMGLFLQDDFKVTRRLSLNVGIRYELESPLTERFDRLVAGFAFDASNPIEAQARANYARNPIPELSPNDFRVLGGLTWAGQGANGRSPFAGEKNNFLPRIGFAYQLTPKTTMRGGYGLFYDTIGVNKTAAIQTGFSQSTPIQASLDNGLTYIANNANPLPGGLLAPRGPSGGLTTNLGQSLDTYFRARKHAYAQRWSLGIQHLLPGQLLADISYVGNRGTRLGVDREYNATPARFLSTSPSRDQAAIDFLSAQFPNPFAGINPIYGARTSRANLLRPFPHFNSIAVEEPIGYSWYHSLQVRTEKRFSQGYTFQLAYTWSKTMEAVSLLNTVDTVPSEVVSDLDRTHRVAASGIYEIPIGRGRRFGSKMPGAVNFLAGGWQINGVVTIQSGQPLGFGNAIFNGDLKNIPLTGASRDVDRWFNTEAGFNRIPQQQLASNIRALPLRFNGIRGDNQNRWDLSAIKNFSIRESFLMQFRAECFNAWNQTNFNNPNTSPTSTAFGRITGTASQARTWQFSLKLKF